MINKLERKFGKYAIPHLVNYLIGGYILGYLLQFGGMTTGTAFLSYMHLDPYMILHGQVWRIITWVLIPPEQNMLFAVIMMIFYWQLGTALERAWGTFRFNFYMFGGIICSVLGALLVYGIYSISLIGTPEMSTYQMVLGSSISAFFSTNYINLSIFLAFAMTYPEEQILLYFFIPIKMKWLGFVYAAFIGFDVFTAIYARNWGVVIAIVASLTNFLIFFLMTRDFRRYSPKEFQRKRNFQRAYRANTDSFRKAGEAGTARHKCCICGRTELTNPELEFRYCSKCNGAYEYCSDHLFTHTHVK
jgi:hypothetical protein